MLKAKV